MFAAVVIWEITSVNFCFDEYQGDVPDDQTAKERAASAQDFITVILVSEPFIDLVSAIALSSIYRAPLDVKSVYKIPVEDTRNWVGTFIVNGLTPFSWIALSATFWLWRKIITP